MKVFYIASNPDGASELTLEREITALQRRASYAGGEPVDFRFLPSLPVEQLPLELLINKPDIVHLSAHGDSGELLLANEKGNPVAVTGSMLRTFLNYESPPKIVYFNACNSKEMAEAVVGPVPYAIGTTALVSNGAARASAVAFYDRLLHGGSVQDAFEVGRSIIEALHDSLASSVLESASAFDARTHRLHSLPRIVARSASSQFRFTKDGFITLECFLVGCPSNTSQVVFFTDDIEFACYDQGRDEPDNEYLARCLCQVIRAAPRRGRIGGDVTWTTCEDFRIYACGTTAGGQTFTVASTLCDALLDYARTVQHLTPESAEMKNVNTAVSRLLDVDQLADPQSKGLSRKRKPAGDVDAPPYPAG
ncbi:CHAT domain-containing protein [Cupriavidus pampae]|uniref:CHAT domain-containing protein n=1 Tax=Cupriavidus pampae TaxID=659251 RepID=A0ABN7Y124_9BURK|nr:hypothetical protein [Cupriavidus pampae]CAG9166136.1 hypothetical protein LMG32289_00935 [Cupriavidus pampae]